MVIKRILISLLFAGGLFGVFQAKAVGYTTKDLAESLQEGKALEEEIQQMAEGIFYQFLSYASGRISLADLVGHAKTIAELRKKSCELALNNTWEGRSNCFWKSYGQFQVKQDQEEAENYINRADELLDKIKFINEANGNEITLGVDGLLDDVEKTYDPKIAAFY